MRSPLAGVSRGWTSRSALTVDEPCGRCARWRRPPPDRRSESRHRVASSASRQQHVPSVLANRQQRSRRLGEGRATVVADPPLSLETSDSDELPASHYSAQLNQGPRTQAATASSSFDEQEAAALPEPSGRGQLEQIWALLSRVRDPRSWSPRARGLVLLNGLILLLASNWVIIKESQQHFDAVAFGGLRFSVAALAFSPFLKGACEDPELLAGGIELGIWSGLGYFTQALGLMTTDASRGSFISAFTVIVVPLLAGVSGKGVKLLTWGSAVLALVGVGLLEQGGKAPNIGDAWGLLSAVLFGVQVFRTEHYSRKLPKGSTLKLMSAIMATVAVMSAGAALMLHPHEVEHILTHIRSLPQMITDGHVPWLAVLYTGLLTTDVALWIEVIALHDVSSTDAAIIYTLEPVLGALFAWVLLDERWGTAGWVGAGLIVASSLATQLWGGEAESEPTKLSAKSKSE